jgi:hypothetical protein
MMRRYTGLEENITRRLLLEALSSCNSWRRIVRRDLFDGQVMGRFARTTSEDDPALVRHPPHRDTQRMDRPTLLQKCSASDDLRHNRLEEQQAVGMAFATVQPTAIGSHLEGEENRLRSILTGKNRCRPKGSEHTALSSLTPKHGQDEDRHSGHSCHRSPNLRRRRSDIPLLNRTTGLAHPRPRFEK